MSEEDRRLRLETSVAADRVTELGTNRVSVEPIKLNDILCEVISVSPVLISEVSVSDELVEVKSVDVTETRVSVVELIDEGVVDALVLASSTSWLVVLGKELLELGKVKEVATLVVLTSVLLRPLDDRSFVETG